MCGLWGGTSNVLVSSEKENIMFLGVLSQFRGMDSTGIAVLRNKEKKNKIGYSIRKAVVDSTAFINSKETFEIVKQDAVFTIMGHCRAATKGALIERNAHPIEEGGLVGCHNGTIGHFYDDKKPEHSDSRELIRRIDTKGLPAALKDAGSGHFAITYASRRDKTLNFIRNEYRPLWFMYNDSETTLYWASEYWMLNALAVKEGFSLFKRPFLLKEGSHFKINFGRVKGESVDVGIKPPPANFTIVRPKLATCSVCDRSEAWCDCDTPWQKGDTSGTGIVSSVPAIGPPRIFAKQETFTESRYIGFAGVKLRPSEVMPLLKKGCACCNKPGAVIKESYWFDKEAFVCESCYDGNDLAKVYLKERSVFKSSWVRGGLNNATKH